MSQQAIAKDVLVAHVNLMTTPTLERLAEKLAETIHDDLASTLFRARERLRVFQGLRITPVVTIDPQSGKLGFTFDAGRQPQDLDATIERLLELPGQLAAERERKVALVLDEFQEIVDIDPNLPRLMRSVFETQPGVAHVYLGSKRHMLERIFNDENEPFWRSAKQMELGVIAPPLFRDYIHAQFERTGRRVEPTVVDRVLDATLGHPYATQELCYFVWAETSEGSTAGDEQYDAALEKLLRAEHAHFGLVWEKAARGAAGRAARARSGARPTACERVPPPARPPGPVERAAGPPGTGQGRAGRARGERRVPDRRALPRRVVAARGAVGSSAMYVAAADRYDRMPYRRCGRSGLELPPISLGLWWNFGHDRPLETSRAIVRRAFDLGITHFDLANNYGPPYGSAEETFGTLMRQDLRPYRDELRRLDEGRLRHVAGPVRRVGIAQVPAREPRPEPRAHGPRLRRHLLLAPLRSRDAARGDDGRARHRRPAGQGAVRRDLVLLGGEDARGRRDPPRPRHAAAHPPAVVLDAEPLDRARPARRDRRARRRLHRLLAARPGHAHGQVPGRHPRGLARQLAELALARPPHRGGASDGSAP